jgi:lysine-specific demethylase 3
MVSDSAQPSTSQQVALRPELQFARCMSNRYRTEQFPRCVSCTRRWAGDTCRFQGIRFFLKDAKRNTVGISFVETDKPDAPSINFPNKWNVALQPSYIRRTKVISRGLLVLRLCG